MPFPVLADEYFECYHFLDVEKSVFDDFTVAKAEGKGLVLYLRNLADEEERNHFSRTYIVIDKDTKEAVAYFSLRAGFVSVPIRNTNKFDTYPGIELEAIAINENFRNKNPELKGLGNKIFIDFAVPLARSAAEIIGVHTFYIFAIPEEKLIKHYESWGFVRLDSKNEDFVHQHIKPKFDDECIFMYQNLF